MKEIILKDGKDETIDLPLNDGTTYHVPSQDVAKYADLYRAVDVMDELRGMYGWLDSNPSKRKTRTGVKAFITRWLKKAQDSGGRSSFAKKPSLREMTMKQMITDITWLPEGQKASARAHFINKYGECYEG